MTLAKRHQLDYDELSKFFKVENGNIICKVDANKKKAGAIVGIYNGEGYLQVRHGGKYIASHRLVFLLTHGYCPEVIDHINGIKDDNRIENLRAANYTENRCNSLIQSNNTSGIKGIHKLKNGGGFQAYISYNKKSKFLGVFRTLSEAEELISLAREMIHGTFANSGARV